MQINFHEGRRNNLCNELVIKPFPLNFPRSFSDECENANEHFIRENIQSHKRLILLL